MDRRFHIIITSEQGRAKTFAVSKTVLKKMLALAVVVSLVFLAAGITYSIQYFNLRKIDSLETNVAKLSSTNRTLQGQVMEIAGQRDAQLSTAYSELNQRSQAIESILSTLEVQTPPHSSDRDSGGPFTRLSDRAHEDLLNKVDQALEALRPLPLGYPVQVTGISSGFGARLDPVNGERSFHEGIDLRGHYGSQVKATADGKVIEQGYNDDYGWYVLLNHGDRYTTLYAHNQKLLTKPGEPVVRGQAIALLGSTGRSTGPHLHYEIRRNSRPVNPNKYLNIAKAVSGNG